MRRYNVCSPQELTKILPELVPIDFLISISGYTTINIGCHLDFIFIIHELTFEILYSILDNFFHIFVMGCMCNSQY